MQLVHPNAEPVAYVDHSYIVIDGHTLINSTNSRATATQMSAKHESYQVYQFTTDHEGYTGWVEIPIVRRARHFTAHI